MAVIKSALELALEKSKDLKLDEVAAKQAELKTEGRRLVGRYLDGAQASVFSDLGPRLNKEEVKKVLGTVAETFIGMIQLPTNELAVDSAGQIFSGLAACGSQLGVAEKQISHMGKQVVEFFTRYLEDIKKTDEAIRKQWAPRLKEKERLLAQQLGQRIRLDPLSDPEFANFYKQHVAALRDQYEKALSQVRQDLAKAFGVQVN